ncbi:hypothetical protein BP5796_07499 [Coleophoma crateriformis]|uniref:Beta-xylosidase n=1 Tax=Coleophoma crateriformis TaxID=565419 RepID=A0A3D8RJ32_9HELO|nr:hypothetical protein BP5796_07499 [Coleophoma crateriformis]
MTLAKVSRNAALQAKISQMELQLAPLVQLTTGEVHPSFPATILNFWLLTSAQLDDLAHFYHQRTPCMWTRRYPCPVEWSNNMSLEEKRRKIGRFIGLRGCESPIRIKTEEEILEEARQARLAEEQEMWRRKAAWY